jgi:hypothetical protein
MSFFYQEGPKNIPALQKHLIYGWIHYFLTLFSQPRINHINSSTFWNLSWNLLIKHYWSILIAQLKSFTYKDVNDCKSLKRLTFKSINGEIMSQNYFLNQNN